MDVLVHQLKRMLDRTMIRFNRSIHNKAVGPQLQRLLNGPANMFNIFTSATAFVLSETKERKVSHVKGLIDLRHEFASDLMRIVLEAKLPRVNIFPPDFDNVMAQVYVVKDALVILDAVNGLTLQGENP